MRRVVGNVSGWGALLAVWTAACGQGPVAPGPAAAGGDAAGSDALPSDGSVPEATPRTLETSEQDAIDTTETPAAELPDAATPASDVALDAVDVPETTGQPDVPDATLDTAPPSCTTAADCKAPQPWCNSSGQCVACLHGGHCKTIGAQCVAGQCQAPVPCQSSKQCNKATGVCDAAFGFCVDCVSQDDCLGGLVCKAKQCVAPGKACKSSKECKDVAGICDTKVGACAECVTATDCDEGMQCQDTLCMPAPPKTCKAGSKAMCTCADGLQQGDKTCAQDGDSWGPCLPCPPPVCKPAELKCDGQKVGKCKIDGSGFATVQDCAAVAKYCVDGQCQDLLCKPGSKTCEAGKLATCAADGKGWTALACDDGNTCTDDTCDEKLGQCTSTPGTKGCDDGNPCTDDGCNAQTGTCSHLPNAAACTMAGGCGLGGVCEFGKCQPAEGKVVTVAGSGNVGFADGAVAAAQLGGVYGVARAPDGSVYFSDLNARRIRKIGPDGVVTTLAGSGAQGSQDAVGAGAQFHSPMGLVRDAAGNLYVADQNNHRIRKVSPSGTVTTFAGSTPGYQDGPAPQAKFNGPQRLSLGPDGSLYVADTVNHRIRRISPQGLVSTLAGSGQQGYLDGQASSAQFSNPHGLAVDALGGVVVADYSNHRIRRIAPDGQVTTLAGSGQQGSQDGAAALATFNGPLTVDVDAGGAVLVAEGSGHKVRRIGTDNVVKTLAGTVYGHTDGPALTIAKLAGPGALAVDGAGRVLVGGTGAIRRYDPPALACNDDNPCTKDACTAGKCVFTAQPQGAACNDGNACTSPDACDAKSACVGKSKACDDGKPCTEDLCNPFTAACEALANDSLTCDDGSKCTPSDLCLGGVCKSDLAWVSTVAGSTQTGFADGKGAAAKFLSLYGVAVDPAGGAMVADADNQRIRRVLPDGTVTTLAGTGEKGYLDGDAKAAKFSNPYGLVRDVSGNLYVADGNNQRIRRISKDGVVSTLAGSGQAGYQDGPGSSAKFNTPIALVIDGSGALIVSDYGNHRIRVVQPNGNVSTLAGSGTKGFQDGAASSAMFAFPAGIAIDDKGSVLVADRDNHRVRRVTPGGVVETAIGTGQIGGTDGKAAQATLWNPWGIAATASGAVFVAEHDGRRIRRLGLDGNVTTIADTGQSGLEDGLAASAKLLLPRGLAVAANGDLWLADSVTVRRITAPAVDCNDNQPCTADTCDPATGKCTNKAIGDGGACKSGALCVVNETCAAGKCGGGKADPCDDGQVCTIDSCDPNASGCKHAIDSGKPGCCNPVVYGENFDQGPLQGWSIANINGGPTMGWQLWANAVKSKSGKGVLYYGNPSQQNFNWGKSSGTADTPMVTLPSGKTTTLKFAIYWDSEGGSPWDKIVASVNPSSGSGVTVWTNSNNSGTKYNWTDVSFDLAGFQGKQVSVRFSFDTGDSQSNNGLGVLVDDLQITTTCP